MVPRGATGHWLRPGEMPMDVHADTGPYPASLTATLDPGISRWLWLVKWLLAIPHLVVLAPLWFAAGVLTFYAGLAILVTGRYPRPLFDFNLGVMRWSWRVAFYAYAALGTDRYPPFSLRSDPTYPADFEVEYPAHLSRGLVLVKWWLLALPQYLVAMVLVGGFGVALGNPVHVVTGSGLIGVLVLVAAVALLFTGTYPRPLFDLTIGLDRWCYRVLAYAALMTDRYPPFRLDSGGADPWAMGRKTAQPAEGGDAAAP